MIEPPEEPPSSYVGAGQHRETGKWHGLYYVNHPTPSGCDRYLLKISDNRGWDDSETAIRELEKSLGLYKEPPEPVRGLPRICRWFLLTLCSEYQWARRRLGGKWERWWANPCGCYIWMQVDEFYVSFGKRPGACWPEPTLSDLRTLPEREDYTT